MYLPYSRNKHNILNQLYFNTVSFKIKKASCTSPCSKSSLSLPGPVLPTLIGSGDVQFLQGHCHPTSLHGADRLARPQRGHPPSLRSGGSYSSY